MSCEIKIIAYSGGNTYNLSNVCGFILQDVDGLGLQSVRRLSQVSPSQSGDTDLGFRQDPRIIILSWVQQERSPADLYNLRELTNGIFRPRNDDETVFHFVFPNGKVYASDVNMIGDLAYRANNRLDGFTYRTTIALKASDQRLYDPEQKSLLFTIIDGYSGWDVEEPAASSPYAADTGWDITAAGEFIKGSGWNIGVADLYTVTTINYAQGALNADVEYPIIRLLGPIAIPTITNQTTKESLPFTENGGLVLGLGEWIEIDLSFSKKTILNQDGIDVSQYLDSSNDLVTFHLSYNTELLSDGSRSTGSNILAVSGDGVTPATSIEILWYDRFVGA